MGCKVIATCAALPRIIEEGVVDEVLIAMPNAEGSKIRSVVEVCEAANVRVKTVPSLIELVNGNVDWRHIRDVRVEDLLRREPVKVNMEEIAAYLRNKRVMVTGGGGSIGAELSRQIASWAPASLVVVDIDETAVFTIDSTLREEFPELHLVSIVADIRDESSMRKHFQCHRPQIVFHAAAYKHVPLMESHPEEAIRTNVIGTRIMARVSQAFAVERFILISTDKAVNPTSVMGATKRVAEMVLQVEGARRLGDNGGEPPTKFMAVRFGNVLGSRGSVLPVFQRQIARGGPVTVTHPEMKRYFMTIPEAVQLVIQAGAIGNGGEVFVLDMGAPVKIRDLAEDLIRLSGYEPGRDIQIVYTGLRPGEKLFEELFTPAERLTHSRHERIFICPSLNGDCSSEVGEGDSLAQQLDRLEEAILTHSISPEECIAELEKLVPTYKAAREADPVGSSDSSAAPSAEPMPGSPQHSDSGTTPPGVEH
jgi:FlaA1/EpsC-like NDP-sugar epimerase